MPKKPTSKELEIRLIEPSTKVEKIMDGEDQKRVLKKLFSVLLLAALFMGIEIAGGIISNSIAILSDAAHMLSDLLGFVISIVSVYISGLPANKQHSYGYHRAGVIGALVSVMVIWVLTAFLIYYAIQRVINLDEVEVEGPIMFGIACFGLLTNLIMIKVLHGDHGHGHSHGHGNPHNHNHSESHGHDHSHESPDHSPKKKTKITDHHSNGHVHIHSHTRGVASMIHENKHKHEKEHAHDVEHDHHEHIYSERPLVVAAGGINNASVISEGAVGLHVHDEHDHHHDHDHDNKKSLSQPADHENMNVRATIIHIFGDILQSIGVIIASSLIWINPKFKIADPIVTFIFAIIVLYTTIKIVKDCIFVLMEGTPADFDLDEFEMKIKDVEGVKDVHDLHVWALGVGKPAMSAHIYADGKPGTVLKKVTKICNSYGISHTTIQVETTKDEQDEDYLDCKHNIH